MDDELFLFLIDKALKAPSGHNSQPWKFRKAGDSCIEILPDFEKQLPAVDPYNRELFISMGCAAENIAIAASARDYEAVLSVSDVIARLQLEKCPSASVSPLYGAIARRQMNRGSYDGKTVPADVLAQLEACGAQIIARENPLYDFIIEMVKEGNDFQMDSPGFKDELKNWIRYNRRDAEKWRDGLSYATFGAPNMPEFVSRTVMAMALKGQVQNKSDLKKIASSSHFALFSGENSIESWVNTGRRVERFLLTAALRGVACAFLNQPCEVLDISKKLEAKAGLALPPQLILRIGYAPEAAWSLRRDISTFIV